MPAKAITATARKLAILVYRTLRDGLVYKIPAPPPTMPSTVFASSTACAKRAAHLGFSLLNRDTGELLDRATG